MSFLAITLFLPTVVFAHQPRITENQKTIVTSPEISKAYYGKLTGAPDRYVIASDKPFDLYVNVLVPDIALQKKDVSVVIFKNGAVLAKLDGLNFAWKKFYEPFGADTYWMGPEYKARAEAGSYEIQVISTNNDSRYSLAVGEIEAFDWQESVNAIAVIPNIKKTFFSKSPMDFITSPLGIGYIILLYILAGIFGFIYRLLLRYFAKGSSYGSLKNIGTTDRWLRFAIAVILLLWAIATTWNPLIIFFSGFALFEAIFSWCGFYAAIGKNTCPL